MMIENGNVNAFTNEKKVGDKVTFLGMPVTITRIEDDRVFVELGPENDRYEVEMNEFKPSGDGSRGLPGV